MATKTYKPTTPSRRNMVTPSFSKITKKKPEKSLVTVLKKNAGRNNTGRITVRHHGGGNRQKYRIIDFKRNSEAINKVVAIEYDPNRTAYIALLQDESGKKSYIVAPDGLSVGDTLYAGEHADIKDRQRPAHRRHSRGAPLSMPSSCIPAEVRSLFVPPAPQRS